MTRNEIVAGGVRYRTPYIKVVGVNPRALMNPTQPKPVTEDDLEYYEIEDI